jgi:hypothetical protein
MKPPIRRIVVLVGVVTLSMVLAACVGPEGPPGPEGPAGPPGPRGAAGPPASAEGGIAAGAEYVGSEVCAECHGDVYENFSATGHASIMRAVTDGEAPTHPFSHINAPPEGTEWTDIQYVIGGYAWKALFLDQAGFLITGEATQYNLTNDDLNLEEGWAAYHAGEENLPYDCGTCHTTGYSTWPPASHQNDEEGLIGTWALDGVQCEACHGPGSFHVQDPPNQAMTISRDSSACLQCHTGSDAGQIETEGVFIDQDVHYANIYQSKHTAMECVDCHDPHATTHYREEAVNRGLDSGLAISCVSCHWQEETFQPAGHTFASCTDCHMAPMAINAVGDEARMRADVNTHLFSINPYADEQFTTDDEGNTYSQPYLTVGYACSRCHGENSLVGPKPIEELQAFARDYHDPARAGLAPLQPTATPEADAAGEEPAPEG